MRDRNFTKITIICKKENYCEYGTSGQSSEADSLDWMLGMTNQSSMKRNSSIHKIYLLLIKKKTTKFVDHNFFLKSCYGLGGGICTKKNWRRFH